MERDAGSPEFNPLRFPPCACPRCRPGPDAAADGVGDADGADADGDSALLRQLRARVVEENALRLSLRRQPS
ncbi:hypothetical protein [Streptomyces montanisoli]|uniref:Uncharacterized protein n=1 Tax=Streptomyces montanisoli TaxID=2798581 RepID=A0A940MH42_9ACTN|nr:hypothetical protein [Streptomyces montanisoli]MBP0459106.1 hypothetical protein [Streptomyces montanisoli]